LSLQLPQSRFGIFKVAAARANSNIGRAAVRARVPDVRLPMLGLANCGRVRFCFAGDRSALCDERDRRKRVAIYGGAFDPITNSHLTCAAEIIHSECVDELWIVPCGPRPDKPNLKTLAIDRLCMCHIGVNTGFSPLFPVKVSTVDCFKTEAAFTYDTLCDLRGLHPDVDFSFVIGSDWLRPGTNFLEWESMNPDWKPEDPKSPKTIVTGHKLLAEFDFLVVKRPGFEVEATDEDPSGLRKFGPRLRFLEMPNHMDFVEGNLSSTQIRQRANVGWRTHKHSKSWLQEIDGLVPSAVLSYILREKLYLPP